MSAPSQPAASAAWIARFSAPKACGYSDRR